MILKKVIPGSASRLTTVDHEETYGRHILEKVIQHLKINKCVDIGCGNGSDLSIVKKHHPNAELFGVDFGTWNNDKLKSLGIQPVVVNIENDRLPFDDESVDLIIGNQVLEHAKEMFWINHEIFRCLKVGGIFFLGVPNVLSLHNRLLMMFGYHPTCSKMISGHIRVFSKKDVSLFYNHAGGSVCKIEKFYGAQFYPFPKSIARCLAKIFPAYAVTSFYIIKKIGQYNNEFLDWPKQAQLETNYFTGKAENN